MCVRDGWKNQINAFHWSIGGAKNAFHSRIGHSYECIHQTCYEHNFTWKVCVCWFIYSRSIHSTAASRMFRLSLSFRETVCDDLYTAVSQKADVWMHEFRCVVIFSKTGECTSSPLYPFIEPITPIVIH